MLKLFQGLIIGVASAALALLLWSAGALDRFEAKTWDWRVMRLAKPGAFTDRIRMIFIDQPSLDWVNTEQKVSWPWLRELYGPILDFCRRQDARTITFDMLYTEPSSYGVPDDEALGAAIARAPGFVGTVFLGRDTGSLTAWPTNMSVQADVAIRGLDVWMKDVNRGACVMPTATFPIPEAATNAAWLGNVQADPDPDAIFRRLNLFTVFDKRAIPALGLAAFLAANSNTTLAIEPGILRVGDRAIPIDNKGRALLRFRGPPGTHRRFGASGVIQSEFKLQANEEPPIKDLAAFKDCYVLLGCNAPGLLDNRPAPVSGVYPGVELHATLLDNLLSGDFMRDATRTATILLVLLLGIIWGILTRFGRNARENVAVFIVALPAPAALCVWAYTQGYWLQFMVLESATIFALVGAVLVNYATEGKQKRFIRGAFKQYLSEEVISQLVEHPERLTLGGEQRTLSIFFSDLQGFTSISEGLNPQALTALLNDYLSAMTDIIQAEGGTVDKYEGDAIIAFWNAPLAQEDHGRRAVQAALRCQRKLAAMRPDLRTRTGKDLFMRVGLNTGAVVVGNMGSHNRFNYTILGDAANLASRLEGINKQFGTYTLISETTRAAMADAFAVREISRVAVVGRKTPVRVFEPMFPEEFAARRTDCEQFARGLEAYYQGRFAEAIGLFQPLQAKDPASAAYIRKCQALAAQPPEAWAGVWVMTEK